MNLDVDGRNTQQVVHSARHKLKKNINQTGNTNIKMWFHTSNSQLFFKTVFTETAFIQKLGPAPELP